jgi:hypothetical protein
MKNILEELLKEKSKCRWRENSMAGDLCTNEKEFEYFFLSDNSYMIAGTNKRQKNQEQRLCM